MMFSVVGFHCGGLIGFSFPQGLCLRLPIIAGVGGRAHVLSPGVGMDKDPPDTRCCGPRGFHPLRAAPSQKMRRNPSRVGPWPAPFSSLAHARPSSNKNMTVPGVAKYHRVQILLVIGVIITLVTSFWTRAFPSLAPAVPHSQQLAAIFPGLLLITPSYKEGRHLNTPEKRPLSTGLPRRGLLGNALF